jgi:Domain of unknown function (DUF4270)
VLHQRIFALFSILCFFCTLAACQSGQDAFDVDFGDPNSAQVQLIDTFTIQSATVLLDSVETRNAPRLLMGRHRDSHVGTAQATAFVEFGYGSDFKLEDEDLYDSLVLSLRYDYHYGDTSRLQTMTIHELTRLMDNTEIYYNTSTTAYAPTPLASLRFRGSPNAKNRKLEIRLPDQLGRRIFQAALGGNLSTNDDWLELLKGLALVPGPTDDAAVLGFRADSTRLELHYHRDGFQDKEEFTRSFRAGFRFNQLRSDKQQTPIAALRQARQALAAGLTNQELFVQAGVGLGVRLDFPHLQILRNYRNGSLNAAKLVFKPLTNTVMPNLPAPPLTLYTVNNRNRLTGFLRASFSRDQAQLANYQVDAATGDGRYEFEVLEYVDQIIKSPASEWDGLMLLPIERVHALDRVIMGSNRNPRYRLKLDLYFTVFR